MSSETNSQTGRDARRPLDRLVRRWHMAWRINMEFRLWANWWHCEALTMPRGMNLWLGWRHLAVWQTMEMAPNDQAHTPAP
jgi:hypothetical protein